MRTASVKFIATCMLGLIAGSPSYGQDSIEIRMGHVLPPTHSWHVAATGFADEVREATENRVKISVFHSAQLGQEKELVEGLQIGAISGGVIGSGSFQPIEPRFGITNLPYAWPSREDAYRDFDGRLGARLNEMLEKKGVIVLSWFEGGYRHVTNSRGPINSPADLAGLKIRVTPDKMRLDTFQALGAEPAPLAFGELYSALQQGLFDAQENPPEIVLGSSFYEVQNFLSMTGHVWASACLVVSKPTWDKISDQDQESMRNLATKWAIAQRKMVAEGERDALMKLEAHGMKINEVKVDPFKAAVQPVWEAFDTEYGSELIDLIGAGG